MDLDAVALNITAVCSSYWLSSIGRLRQSVAAVVRETGDIDQVLSRARDHALRGQKGRAANWIAVAFLLDQPRTVVWLKREGLLRASKFHFEPTVPRFLVAETLVHADDLMLGAETRSWLTGASALLAIATAARAEFVEMMSLLRHEPYTFLRSCLVTLDLLFMREGSRNLDFGLPWNLEPFTKEDLAEGFSLLWSHAHREIRVTRRSAGLWDANGIYVGRYLQLLKRAASLREYSESEILVEAFSYRCAIDSEGTAVVSAPIPEVEKGIRLGYIEGEMQRMRLIVEAQAVDAASLRDLGQQLHSAMVANGCIHLVDAHGPLSRVRFEFPLASQFTGMIRDARAMREELPGVVETLDTYGLTPAQVQDYRIGDHLTIRDVQQTQRLAAIVAFCVANELYARRNEPVVFVNSASPVYRTDDAIDRFLGVALNEQKAREFREIFRWPPASAELPGGFDVQYRPLLEAEHEWHVPMSILAFSDLTRAALQLTGRRPNTGLGFLEAPLVRAFQEAGHLAVADVKLRAGGNVVAQIDVAALVDDTLIVLECKNSLLPCNVFELRTSRAACVDAAEQLDRARAALEASGHRDALLTRLGGAERAVAHVVTGIIVGNRLFIGSRFGHHLVASPGHLSNVIRGGEIHVAGRVASIRPTGVLTGDALREFFTGSFYDRLFAAMVPVDRVVQLANKRLRFESYALDFIALGREFGIEIDPEEFRRESRNVMRSWNGG